MPGVDTAMKAILTLATGYHKQLLEIAAPSFRAFADRHGWDIYQASNIGQARPPAWYKVQTILSALRKYDEVLFLGADTLIVDGREDLVAPPGAWQALVAHHTGDGEVPNTDVWLCRQPMIPYLEQIWNNTQWIMHGWWEQAALLESMGYQVLQPTHLVAPTELYQHTYFLDPCWNVHKWHKPAPASPRIQHATMYPDRAEIMMEWAKQAEGWINGFG